MKRSEPTIPDSSALSDWCKSSYSGGSSDNCVEVTTPATYARWRKSSYSDESGGTCIEANDTPHHLPVRDSKNPTGPALVFSAPAWQAFVTSLGRTTHEVCP